MESEVRKQKYGNGSTETEIRKWEEKPPIGAWFRNVPCRQTESVSKRCESHTDTVFSALLTHLRCESRIFGSRTAAHVAIAMSRMCMWQPDTNQDKRWVHGPTMWALRSWNVLTVHDADASVVIVRLQWLYQLQNYSETLANTVVSERDQDKTTRTVSF